MDNAQCTMHNGQCRIESAELVKALRCCASPWNGTDEKEVCKGCPYLMREVPTEVLKPLANKEDGMLWSCDVDRIAMDAADRIEELAEELVMLRGGGMG